MCDFLISHGNLIFALEGIMLRNALLQMYNLSERIVSAQANIAISIKEISKKFAKIPRLIIVIITAYLRTFVYRRCRLPETTA